MRQWRAPAGLAGRAARGARPGRAVQVAGSPLEARWSKDRSPPSAHGNARRGDPRPRPGRTWRRHEDGHPPGVCYANAAGEACDKCSGQADSLRVPAVPATSTRTPTAKGRGYAFCYLQLPPPAATAVRCLGFGPRHRGKDLLSSIPCSSPQGDRDGARPAVPAGARQTHGDCVVPSV